MVGNVSEWTTENCTLSGTSNLINRGGNYSTSGSSDPAAYRIRRDYARSIGNIGFRVVLYK